MPVLSVPEYYNALQQNLVSTDSKHILYVYSTEGDDWNFCKLLPVHLNVAVNFPFGFTILMDELI